MGFWLTGAALPFWGGLLMIGAAGFMALLLFYLFFMVPKDERRRLGNSRRLVWALILPLIVGLAGACLAVWG